LTGLRSPASFSIIWLNSPILGLAIRIHEMAIRMPGMTMRPISMNPKRPASGVLVRASTHAMKAPITKATSVEASAKLAVLLLVCQKAALP
jgi:hypothetical protein